MLDEAAHGAASPTCGSGTPTASYSYDRVGNRTAMTNAAGTTTYSYDGADRLLSVTPPGSGATSYSYDGNGAVTARGSDSFTWNSAQQLTSASIAGSDPQSFTYNGDGLRQTRIDTATNVTTSFVWDVASKVPVVIDDGSQYVYGANGLVEQVVNGTPSYYLSDGLGSTLAVCDGSGTVQQTYSYDVYGQATAGVNNHPTEYGFAGQQADPTELQYLRARYYDPTTGRFLSRDPLSAADPAGHQPYAYAGDNPASLADPTGKCPGIGGDPFGGEDCPTGVNPGDPNVDPYPGPDESDSVPYGADSDSTTDPGPSDVPEPGSSSTLVIGSGPYTPLPPQYVNYIQSAVMIGGEYMGWSEEEWAQMEQSGPPEATDAWQALASGIDSGIEQGDQITASNWPPPSNSYFSSEAQYLADQGCYYHSDCGCFDTRPIDPNDPADNWYSENVSGAPGTPYGPPRP
ncbi:MAG TPA: RHS repeat-associated core domain-containing protein [Gemmataceae bacterium]|nr:RHS repeat-associated core domain-containing protein [Gemmataceae bacterium]